MGLLNDILDFASDMVQSMTGEKKRRERVAEIKTTYEEFKTQVISNVDSVNNSISELNSSIKELNDFRANDVPRNIVYLGDFLGHFGNVKAIGMYAEEESACYVEVPEHRFIYIEDYITDIDWSKEDVFINTFFLSPLGIRKKTEKQNLSMLEQLNSLKLEAEQTILELKNLKFAAEQDKKISELYIYCVERIITYIEKVIVPELDVVETFFQALSIKNMVVTDTELQDVSFKNNIDLIRDTQYQNHYQFVRNTFLFYVIACKIYNTPVLTNLLKGITSDADYVEIDKEKKILEDQIQNVNQFLVFKRGET